MSASTSALSDGGAGSSGSGSRYDVFLSFRGEDTRLNFTDHLYSALIQRGITTFRDEESLKRGGPIPDTLFEAIERSRYSVVVFSKNYASSSWCLNELDKIYCCAKESNGRRRLTVLPVFYDVDPSDVRKQTGDFAAAFAEHERVYGKDSDVVLKWRKALKEVANLSGWDLRDKHQSIVLQEIVGQIFKEVNSELSFEQGSLVGMVHRAEKLLDNLLGSSDDTGIVGIVGMGGIGKTTIARVVYERMRGGFDCCSFLANVREMTEKKAIVSLQEQLLRDVLKDERIGVPDVGQGISMIRNCLKSLKVLLVLDDVDDGNQLEDRQWFGQGSRVLVTARDLHLLHECGVDKIFYPEKLDDGEALRLFSLRAFKEDYPPEPYLQLSGDFVEYAHGLPLALRVLGSFLSGRSVNEWKSKLNSLKTMPMGKINDVLRISFDGLDRQEKDMFLDIACFFNGDDENHVMKILDACGHDPYIGVRVLRDKSMVNEGKLGMHDLLRQMGKEIVRQESPRESGRRSRLWSFEDARYVLENNEGSRLVEGVYLPESDNKSAKEATSIEVDPKAFNKMRRLRLLKLWKGNIFNGLRYLPNELRYLEWHHYSLQSLPSRFQPNNLVELRMPHSQIEKLYLGTKPLKNLRHLDLSYSTSLVVSPDFSLLPNLEEILFAGCVGLSEIHHSIAVLKRLSVLNLNGCENLVRLPLDKDFIELDEEDLVELSDFRCLKLPEIDSLELPDDATSEHEFSPILMDFEDQSEHEFSPSAMDRPRATGVPLLDALSNFRLLGHLNLSRCDMPDLETPVDLSCLSALQELDLKGNSFTRVPFDISGLDRLDNLWLSYCDRLKVLPKLPGNIRTVAANHCTALRALLDNIGLGCSEQCDFSFVECHKLVDYATDDGADCLLKSILRNLLQIVFKEPDLGRTFNFYLPGSEVPKWFLRQSMGATTMLELDPDWFVNDSFKGFVVCAVFFAGNQENNSLCSYDFNYGIRVDGTEQPPTTSFIALKSFGAIQSKHLWVSYVFRRQWACQNGVKVQFHSYDPATEVISCGIHPVYSNQTECPNGFLGLLSSLELPDLGKCSQAKRERGSCSGTTDGAESIVCGSFDEGVHPKRSKGL